VGGGQGKQYGVNVQKIRNIIEQKTMRYYYDVTASTSNEKITESPNRIRRKAGRRKKPVDGLIQAKLDIFIGLNRSTPGLIVSGGGDKAGDVRKVLDSGAIEQRKRKLLGTFLRKKKTNL
jgi:hypothetical protein